MEETMDPKQIAKQMVDFNKTAFDNSFERDVRYSGSD